MFIQSDIKTSGETVAKIGGEMILIFTHILSHVYHNNYIELL